MMQENADIGNENPWTQILHKLTEHKKNTTNCIWDGYDVMWDGYDIMFAKLCILIM